MLLLALFCPRGSVKSSSPITLSSFFSSTGPEKVLFVEEEEEEAATLDPFVVFPGDDALLDLCIVDDDLLACIIPFVKEVKNKFLVLPLFSVADPFRCEIRGVVSSGAFLPGVEPALVLKFTMFFFFFVFSFPFFLFFDRTKNNKVFLLRSKHSIS